MPTEEWIRIECKKCGFKGKTSIKNAGKRGKCRKCQGEIIVPKIEEEDSLELFMKKFEEELTKIDEEKEQKRQQRQQRNKEKKN